jgi:SAM-dependent methyltransferase
MPSQFAIDETRWFCECDRCATVVMLPLEEYASSETYGMAYYDQHPPDETAEEHAVRHFEEFQRHNYDNVRAFLQRTHPPASFPRWLDVGSVGYPTTFDDYVFTTVEPDPRAVRAGRRHFQSERIHCATVETWHGEAGYDGILFNNSFYCITTPAAALRAARELLRPGGHLVITLATYLNGAVSDRVDGKVLLIEDVLYGETLQVYYNEYSLRYLAGRHGFRFVGVTEVPAYGHKTMQAYVFERTDESRHDLDLLTRSRQQMDERWSACFSGFRESIVQTLAAINTPRTVLAGSPAVVRDLQRYGDLSQVRGFLPVPNPHMAGCRLGNVLILGPADLADVPPHAYEVVVCDFRAAKAVAATVRHLLGPAARLRMPTRQSGMNVIDFSFRDGLYPSKGFALGKVSRPARATEPVTVGRRVVVFGAGAGGRQVLAALRGAGHGDRVVAVCDNDDARVGSLVEGFAVQRFATLDAAAFDFVIIASAPGRAAISTQLDEAGFASGFEYAGVECLKQDGGFIWA